jgi:diaminohydroxyphosphoribosylaminopyrimidine deaminase/5-amino-6-(5-phosphoribosylamino)uracil reductase
MRRALAVAERGLGRTTPNPVVGCCIVTAEGVVVGDGAHERAGGPHAEIHALEEAGPLARGATLYCTLEPCVHTGRTGPCTERIIAAGVARVVAAMEDPDPRVAGRGIATLRAHGIDVVVGLERDRAERLNRGYLMCARHGRPWVILKAAMSADGHIAAAPGARTQLTSAPANRHAQLVRAGVDAVAIGSGTLLADDPLLTVREVYRERPLTRVVFDRRLRTPAGARLLTTLGAGPVIILTSSQTAASHPERVRALAAAGAQVLAMDTPSVAEGLRVLASRHVQCVLFEGGPTLHKAALAEGVVDQLHLYVASRVVGRQGVPWLADRQSVPKMDSLVSRAVGRDVFLEGYVHRTH